MPGISVTITLSFTCIVTRESLQSVLCVFCVFVFACVLVRWFCFYITPTHTPSGNFCASSMIM